MPVAGSFSFLDWRGGWKPIRSPIAPHVNTLRSSDLDPRGMVNALRQSSFIVRLLFSSFLFGAASFKQRPLLVPSVGASQPPPGALAWVDHLSLPVVVYTMLHNTWYKTGVHLPAQAGATRGYSCEAGQADLHARTFLPSPCAPGCSPTSKTLKALRTSRRPSRWRLADVRTARISSTLAASRPRISHTSQHCKCKARRISRPSRTSQTGRLEARRSGTKECN
ncbi:hypothetical protein B0H19DRAFT_1384658 [Mycena capillaripes]|nr:hypothetical protein B0H19DRAFT_1384658 [Mycena capillaripes]